MRRLLMSKSAAVEIDMATKLAVLQNELASRKPVSLFEAAVISEAKRDAPASPVPAYPKQPDDSPWSSDPCGTEPPLGYDINKVDQ
jgi:hypothetical protein